MKNYAGWTNAQLNAESDRIHKQLDRLFVGAMWFFGGLFVVAVLLFICANLVWAGVL